MATSLAPTPFFLGSDPQLLATIFFLRLQIPGGSAFFSGVSDRSSEADLILESWMVYQTIRATQAAVSSGIGL